MEILSEAYLLIIILYDCIAVRQGAKKRDLVGYSREFFAYLPQPRANEHLTLKANHQISKVSFRLPKEQAIVSTFKTWWNCFYSYTNSIVLAQDLILVRTKTVSFCITLPQPLISIIPFDDLADEPGHRAFACRTEVQV